MIEGVRDRPVDLGGAAEGIGVLDGVIEVVGVAGPDLASLQQLGDSPRRGDLTGVGPEQVDVISERPGASHHRFHRDRACRIAGEEETAGGVQAEDAHGRHSLGSVEERQPFLGQERDGLQPGLGCGDDPTIDPHPAFADQGQGHVGEGGQVARGTHRAL